MKTNEELLRRKEELLKEIDDIDKSIEENNIEEEITLKVNHINKKYLNRNGDGYRIILMKTDIDERAAYFYREGNHDNEVLKYIQISYSGTMKMLEDIEERYSSELMQRKIDAAAELMRMNYKIDHHSVISTLYSTVIFNVYKEIKRFNGRPVKYMDTKYYMTFEDDGTLTVNVDIKYTTLYLASMVNNSLPEYKSVDNDLIKGTFDRYIRVINSNPYIDIGFTDEFRIHGIKNFDISKAGKYTNELFKLTENNDCDFYRIKEDN